MDQTDSEPFVDLGKVERSPSVLVTKYHHNALAVEVCRPWQERLAKLGDTPHC